MKGIAANWKLDLHDILLPVGMLMIATILAFQFHLYSLVKKTKPVTYKVTEVIKKGSLTREEINERIKNLIVSGRIEEVYRFYDEYTGNREITYNIINNGLAFGIPVNLLFSLAYVESQFTPTAINGKKNKDGTVDYGLFQINSYTFRQYTRKYCMKLENNVRLASTYLVEKYRKYGNWEEAFLSYNAGNTELVKNGSIKHFIGVLKFERKLDKKFNERF